MKRLKILLSTCRWAMALYRANRDWDKVSSILAVECRNIITNRIQEQQMQDLVILTSLERDVLKCKWLQLGISLHEMKVFFIRFGYLPSAGIAIGIKHFGVDLVIDCIEENSKLAQVRE
jgi:hypothetical protein